MDTGALCSVNAVVKKHPNVNAAITLRVKANIVFALDKNVFILLFPKDTTTQADKPEVLLKMTKLCQEYTVSHSQTTIQP